MTFFSRLRRRHGVVFVASVAIASVLLGGGAAYAVWTAVASATGTASTQRVAIEQTGFAGLSTTYLNSSLNQPVTDNTTLSSTAAFTVTNTGEAAGAITVTAESTDAMASSLQVRTWTVASAANCTPAAAVPSGASSGTWAGATALNAVATAPGTAIIICARTTAPRTAVASTSGAMQATATLTASIAASGWTAQATATQVQKTLAVYPLTDEAAPLDRSRWYKFASAANANSCLDVSGSSTSVGGLLISYGCGANQINQRFQVVPVGASQSLVTLRPRHAPAMRIADSGTRTDLQTAGTALAQQWYVQKVSNGTYQFVSASTGRCLSVPSTTVTSAIPTVACSDASSRIVLTRDPLAMTVPLLGCASMSFNPNLAGAFQLQRWNGASWVQIARSATQTSTSVNAPMIELAEGENSLRIVYGTAAGGADVAYDGIVVEKTTVLLLSSCSIVSGNGS